MEIHQTTNGDKDEGGYEGGEGSIECSLHDYSHWWSMLSSIPVATDPLIPLLCKALP